MRFVLNCVKSIFNYSSLLLQRQTSIMASTSSCGPTAEKKIKLDVSVDENVGQKEPNHWRSKLNRNFDEIDVGITEFIGNHKPFEGVLKNRYEDFVVHEVSKSGKIIRLTDNKVPEEEVVPVLDVYEVLNDDIIEEIKELCDEDIEEDIDEENGESMTKKRENVKILVTKLNKFERTKIHKAIRDNFSNLETLTVDENSDKYIIVKKFDKNTTRRSDVWPKHKGEYIQFFMYKENKETQQAINEIALRMHVSPKNFTYAGTKDKRAITTQQMSVWKVPPRKIWAASQKNPAIQVGHFSFQKETLRLGDLSGNHFDIVLRDIKYDNRDESEIGLNSVKNIGFINYFGMQRFGHQYTKPYKIGILILQKKWKEVVEEILTKKANDLISYKSYKNPDGLSFNECIELWKTTRDANSVYKKFAFKSSPEGTLLKGLTRVQSDDFHGALCTGMHRNSRLLYLHCYQSYLWNKTASYRFRTYGLKVVEGDLIAVNPDCEDGLEVTETDDQNNSESKPKSFKVKNSNVVYADKQNIDKYSIYDIVIPLVGSDVLLPKNCVSEYIESLLSEENITIDLFKDMPNQWHIFGGYRRLIAKPEPFDWSWISYNDPNIPLVESDIQLIKKSSGIESEPMVSTGDKLALKLSMCLQSSCYATMVCRQIFRTESTDLEFKPWLMNK